MIKSVLFVGLVSATALWMPNAAEAFSGKKGTRVNPVDDAVFEVVARTAGSASDYWCGAADYARRALNVSWTATLYISRGRGPSETTNRRTAVQYTLDPGRAPGGTQNSILQFGDLIAGDKMSVQRAYQYCTMPIAKF